MIYPYKCPICANEHEVVKSAIYATATEYCPKCKGELQRVYTAPQIAVTHSAPSQHFGIDMANKAAVSDMRKKYSDTHNGSELIPIGNEKPKLTPKRQSYDLSREEKAQIYG